MGRAQAPHRVYVPCIIFNIISASMRGGGTHPHLSSGLSHTTWWSELLLNCMALLNCEQFFVNTIIYVVLELQKTCRSMY